MSDLIELLVEYKKTLKDTRLILNDLEKVINITKADKTQESKELLAELEEDKRVINSWISNLQYSIKWLSTGRRPGSTRGIERRSVYQNEIKSEKNAIRLISYDNYQHDEEIENEIDSYKAQMASEIVQTLTNRQKEILELYAQKFSYEEIGSLLGITKQTAWETIETCKMKIESEGWVMS